MCQASSHANFSSSSKIRISSGIAKTGCVSLMWIAIFHVVDEGHHIFLYAFERYFANLLIRGNTVVLNEVFFPHHAYHADIKLRYNLCFTLIFQNIFAVLRKGTGSAFQSLSVFTVLVS